MGVFSLFTAIRLDQMSQRRVNDQPISHHAHRLASGECIFTRHSE